MNDIEPLLLQIASACLIVKIAIHVHLLKTNTDEKFSWDKFPFIGRRSEMKWVYRPVTIPVSEKQYNLKMLANILFWICIAVFAVMFVRISLLLWQQR